MPHALDALGLILASFLWAQSSLSVRCLERWWLQGYYTKIIAFHEKQPQAIPTKGLPYVASAYYRQGQLAQAYDLYKQAFAGAAYAESQHYFEYAQILHHRGEARLARTHYQLAIEKGASPEDVSLYLAQLEAYQNRGIDTTFTLSLLSQQPNGPTYGAYYALGQLYYLHRTEGNQTAIYALDGLPYEQIGPSSLPTGYRYHQGVVGFRPPDTLLLYLSKGQGSLYWTCPANTQAGWTKPKCWPLLPKRPKGIYSYCEDPLTKAIYFVSDHGGKSLTKKDIYRMAYLGNGWYAPPQKLPAPINTPYDEDAPFIVGDTLYFASNGPASMGGYDIFYAIRQPNGEWGQPIAMPKPINSPAHDIYFYPFDAEHTYLSSDRTGVMRIYQISRQPLPIASQKPEVNLAESTATPTRLWVLTCRVQDSRSGQGLPAQFILVDSVSQKEVLVSFADATGQCRLYLPQGGAYYLYVQHPGYITHVQPLTLPQVAPEEPIPLRITLLPIEMEATFELRNIYFDFNSDKLQPASLPELERLLRLLKGNPNIRIRFSGHTDNVGSDHYTKALSERRARAVYRWLLEHGIHPIQMEYVGYGKSRPIASNATAEGRALNRRIEMEIVGIRKAPGEASTSQK